ncbi:hypothetical protein JXA85_04325 [Candidatus Woesearchaeota archaeon]|nr:hypothetical protein [Candidatus Woesearchaeota archaeon]
MKQEKKELPYDCIIDVEYMPFPSYEAKREAYYTQAKLFLRAKEREITDMYKKPRDDKKGRAPPLSAKKWE